MNICDDINSKLDELYQTIRPNDFSWLEDARKTFSLFIKFEKLKDFIKALECVREELEKDSTKAHEMKVVNGLLKDLQRSEPDFLIENLKRAGYAVAQNNKSIRDAINREALRMLEQVRLGKRDTVIGMLMRNFIIRNIKMPAELVEALKPKYDINLFRAFIYAFLSGFITTEE
ncbi:hypothetical protein A45J_1834 [hot springs metagenome]|uniref:Uncharacterized protein n=1 Tax=hot springs metagenome TaxID=433727 RepID=A0A5J4L958_9ZZZZ